MFLEMVYFYINSGSSNEGDHFKVHYLIVICTAVCKLRDFPNALLKPTFSGAADFADKTKNQVPTQQAVIMNLSTLITYLPFI